jgi:bud site selection protein 31
MSKFGRKQRPPPEGFEYIEGTLDALENELRDKVNESHEGMRKNETQWPIHQINYQRSRYVYDLYYKHHRISKEVYDHCVTNKLVDAQLIAKWKKPGYEKLCSTYSIDPKNFKFGSPIAWEFQQERRDPNAVESLL